MLFGLWYVDGDMCDMASALSVWTHFSSLTGLIASNDMHASKRDMLSRYARVICCNLFRSMIR